ncbi:hypothetical protein F5883DRAFT_105557 [Diaporthe sp. PMI_573]|nr:hypothetical protein F5883DRAFT_105557 [Diaporthaceae sp. PMI_573]
MGRPSSFALLSTSSVRLSHSRTVHSLALAGLHPRPRPRFCTSTRLLHPLPTYLPFTALSSPLRQSTVLHFEPSAGQVKAKANKQPAVSAGNILWGSRPSKKASTGPPEIATLFRIPLNSYTRLSARVTKPTSPCFNAHSEHRPVISRTHCHHSQPPDPAAHSSPTTPRQPG